MKGSDLRSLPARSSSNIGSACSCAMCGKGLLSTRPKSRIGPLKKLPSPLRHSRSRSILTLPRHRGGSRTTTGLHLHKGDFKALERDGCCYIFAGNYISPACISTGMGSSSPAAMFFQGGYTTTMPEFVKRPHASCSRSRTPITSPSRRRPPLHSMIHLLARRPT